MKFYPIAIALLSLITFLPSSAFCMTAMDGSDATDHSKLEESKILTRLFDYQRNFGGSSVDSIKKVYIKSDINTLKRNATLMIVPSMYSVSRGNRSYVGEALGVLKFKKFTNFTFEESATISTVPHSRRILPHLIYYIVPNLYGECLFRNNILSPFNRENRSMYKYIVTSSNFGRVIVHFRPRHANTQLVWGYAMLDTQTGRIIRTSIKGEFDMIKFDVRVDMGHEDRMSIFPRKSNVSAVFSLMGNKISSQLSAIFDDNIALPDSIKNLRELMDSLRPRPITQHEEETYLAHFGNPTDSVVRDSLKKKKSKFYDVAWDVIGDYLIGSMSAKNERGSIKMSPLVNPLYLSYSKRKGLSYKMKIGARYRFSDNVNLSLNPQIGYNFKIKKIFVNAPLRFTFDKSHDGWVELSLQNGNVITNSEVLKKIKGENRDTINFSSLQLDYFKDYSVNLKSNFDFSRRFGISLGASYHSREALNKEAMWQSGNPSIYRSFAPSISFTLIPFKHGPVFTANYERSFTRVMRSNTEYERVELDAVYNKKLHRLRQYNIRVGGGFYTNKSSQYFVDFENFHENYLPGGWDDDWTGDFQLLNSEWYNASRYYFRTNLSYESPMMILSWLPWLGNFVETERFYYSYLEIESTRPYSEIGYAFSTRFVSVGLFASFLTGHFNEIGTKFTFELFRKW